MNTPLPLKNYSLCIQLYFKSSQNHLVNFPMVLKLYGVEQGFTKIPALVLHEKNVHFELVPVNKSGGELKSDACLAKQPFGEMPYIVRFFSFPRKTLVLTKASLMLTACYNRTTTDSSYSNRSPSPDILRRSTKIM